jgi:arsenite methyltransferase
MTCMAKAPDRWHRWLMDVRFGGDPAVREHLLTELLYPVRDTVLDKAQLQPGDTVLDVGAGDGLIAFGALGRLGPSGHVIFSDISQDLLDHCRAAAAAEGLLDRCRFMLASADSLDGVADASVDVVTARSVLIYVKDKAAALREFWRVLRPGGRISVFEPVNVLIRDPDRFLGHDIMPVRPLAAKVRALYESIQPPGEDPMLDFDDRDLVRHAEQAGFAEIGLELRVTVKNGRHPVPWERVLRMAGNPRVPPLGEALDRALSPQEVTEFTAYFKPLVESGGGQERNAVAYLTAAKELGGAVRSHGEHWGAVTGWRITSALATEACVVPSGSASAMTASPWSACDQRGELADAAHLRTRHLVAPSDSAIRRTAAGGSVPADLACRSVVPHQARSSSRILAAAAARWPAGWPSGPNAASTNGMITLLRSGTISASIAIWARCSMARVPPAMPPLYATHPAGLVRNANVAKTVSIAFFSTAGTLWLYSGVMNKNASPSAITEFHRFTTGAENVGFLKSPTVASVSPKMGRSQSRRSATSTSNPPCARERYDPGGHLVGGPAWSRAANNDLQVEHVRS